MKVIKYLAITLCMVIVSSVAIASKTAQAETTATADSEELPKGSYSKLCKGCSVQNGILTCERCQQKSCHHAGPCLFRPVVTNVSIALDKDNVAPIDLTFNDIDGFVYVVSGSYHHHCKNCTIHSGILQCKCLTGKREWKPVSLKIVNGKGDIVYHKGTLVQQDDLEEE